MTQFKFDRNVFRAGKLEDQDRLNARYWSKKSIDERMQASWYMTCKAYGLDPKNPPRMDKTFFKAEKRFS